MAKNKKAANWCDIVHTGQTIQIQAIWRNKRWETLDGRFWYDSEAADFAAGFFPTMLVHHLGLFDGLKFTLLPYQEYLVRGIFGWKHIGSNLRRFRKVFCAVPKGSGKSPLCSGLGLLLAFFDQEPGAEVLVVANDKTQGRIIHDTSKVFVHRSEVLSTLLEVFTDSIKLKGGTESLRVLSSDVATSHGFRPHAILYDEFHAARDRNLFEALHRGTAKRAQPLTVMVSTAGNDDESICFEEWSYAENIIKNPSVDESYFPMIFQATAEDDWTDLEVWKRVNPGYGITVRADYFENECRAAILEPRKRNSFLQLHLNRWVSSVSAWLGTEQWDACSSTLPPESELVTLDVCAGLDMSRKGDLTSFVLCFRRVLPGTFSSEGPSIVPLNYELIVIPHFWIPADTMREHEKTDGVPYGQWVERGWVTATEGNSIDYSRVHADILKIAARFPRLRAGQIGHDATFAGDVAQQLSNAGYEIVDIPQRTQHLSEPSQVFESLLKAKRIIHDENRCMRWCIENASIKTDADGRIRPVKPRQQSKRIDGTVAAILALSRLMGPSADARFSAVLRRLMTDDQFRELIGELRMIRTLLAPARCSNADHVLLSRLVPVLVESFGTEQLFTVRDILLDEFAAVVTGNMSATQLGALLSRAEADRINVKGFTFLRHPKRDHNLSIWQLIPLTS